MKNRIHKRRIPGKLAIAGSLRRVTLDLPLKREVKSSYIKPSSCIFELMFVL